MTVRTNALKVQAFAGALFGVQVGTTTMAQVNADITSGGFTNTLNNYYTSSFANVPNATVAASVAAKLGLTGNALTSGTAYITAQLNASAAGARGAVISTILDLFAGLTADATYGAAATAWNAKVDAASVYKGTDNIAIGAGTTYQLSVGLDDVVGSAGADMFNARVGQNANGEQTNQLATGDSINGGAGNDTLKAVIHAASSLNAGPSAAVRPITVDVEVAQITAIDATGSGSTRVFLNAASMNGLNEIGSVNSDVDLVIQNLNTLKDDGVYADRRNTKDMTIRYDHSGNNVAVQAQSDLIALFDNDYLLSDSSSSSMLELRMVNNLSLKIDNKPLASFSAVSFKVGTVDVVTQITPAMQALVGTAAYTELVSAIRAQLQTQNITGVTVSEPENAGTTVFSVNVETFLQGEVAGSYSLIRINSTQGALSVGQTTLSSTNTSFNGVNTQNTSSSSAENPIEVSVELYKVGRGGEGGELIIGGMATDGNNNWDYSNAAQEEGVQVFNIRVSGDNTQFSSLAGLASTNNTLETVNVTWATDSRADLIIGNRNTLTNLGNTNALPNGANNTFDNFRSVTTEFNDAMKDVRVFTASNNGTTAASASKAAITTDVTLHAHVSDQAVVKYMNLKDSAANQAADNANFVYNFGTGNDTLNLNISKANLAASGSANREDFSFAVNTGAGNDTVVTQIGDGKSAATEAWFVNATIQDNLNINAGDGNDTVHVNGAGNWAIDAGIGNDAIYSDNSGRQLINAGSMAESTAVWVFNSNSQTQSATNTQTLHNLQSATAVTSIPKVGNLDLTVSYRGINVTVEVGTTHSTTGGAVTDLVINQAIKKAINENVYLKNLLSANDGPGRTLIVTSKTDGVFSDADLSVSLANTKVLSLAQTTDGVAYIGATQLGTLGFSASGTADAAGRYDSAIADDSVGTQIVGFASVEANENKIDAGLGNDTVVLSTSSLAKETVNVASVGGTASNDSDVVFNASAGATIVSDQFDTIISSGGIVIRGGVGSVSILTTGVTGTAAADTINALSAVAAQTLTGLAGNDTITASSLGSTVDGGEGSDTINLAAVGTGTDKIVFNSLVGTDTIAGYNVANDSIELSKAIFTGLGPIGTLGAAEFLSGANTVAATDGLQRIIVDTTTGAVRYDADGNGAGVAVLIGTFTTVTGGPLVVSEFAIVA